MPKMIKANYEYAGFLYNIWVNRNGVKEAVPQSGQHYKASKDVHRRNALESYEQEASEAVKPRKKHRGDVSTPTLAPVFRAPDIGRDEMWKQKDGSLIAVCDMSELHVRNALRMVIRKARLWEAKKWRFEDDIEFDDTWGEGIPE